MNELSPVSFKKGRQYLPRLSKPYDPGKPRDERFWTEAEDEIIRRHYPAGGYQACAALLPQHKTGKAGIYRRAQMLGVKSSRQAAVRQSHPTSPELDQVIRDAWPELEGKGAVNGLADRLGVPRWWLSKRATKLELTSAHRKEPPWSKAELALLPTLPLHDLTKAAEIMREHGYSRSPVAIKVRIVRLGISQRSNRATISGTEAAKILGMNNKTTTQWCVMGELKAEKLGTKRLPQQGGDVWAIERSELRRYVIDNIERLDIRKVDKVAFVDLLVRDDRARVPDEPPPMKASAIIGSAIARLEALWASPKAKARERDHGDTTAAARGASEVSRGRRRADQIGARGDSPAHGRDGGEVRLDAPADRPLREGDHARLSGASDLRG
jgi:hypothetical protein